MNVIELGPSNAKDIVSLYNDTLEQIQKAEDQLILFSPILGEAKNEESISFDLRLDTTYHFGVVNGKKLVGYIGVQQLNESYPQFFPQKTEKNKARYPQQYKTFYITNLALQLVRDKNENLIYDFNVLRLLLNEVVKQTKFNDGVPFDGIVLNLPERYPTYLAQMFATEGFKGVGIKPKFFNNEMDSWFLELKLREDVNGENSKA